MATSLSPPRRISLTRSHGTIGRDSQIRHRSDHFPHALAARDPAIGLGFEASAEVMRCGSGGSWRDISGSPGGVSVCAGCFPMCLFGGGPVE
jgi:hypothetical protein